MSTLREAAQQALRVACMCTPEQQIAKEALRAALAQKEHEPTARYKCTVVDAQHPNGVPFEQWVNAPQEEQEPVAYTGDVARRMREAEMTFHLGMPHAVVMQQMTRFHDLVCAEVSIKAAVAFAHPPRREWQSLSEEDMEDLLPLYSDPGADAEMLEFARAIEAKLKEKNNA